MDLPVQNPPAASASSAAAEADHASAVYEKRFWLRISWACNNQCLFCLDADHRPAERFVPLHEVEQSIRQAAAEGYQRLILSGGEATINPDFLAIVRFGRSCGFRSIQTITNGRMFSYAAFASASVQAGLTEATFSIHGHTAALHDELTGVPGAFDQACQGIRNLTRRCIVNIDIVVTRRNVAFVDRIIQRFSELGVYEYDLMHPVPFGRAFDHRAALFFDHRDASEHLARAFAFSRQREVYHIWTNRFPPAALEGFEELIQDPHKLYDEVQGRRHMFEAYAQGREFDCYPERCPFCFIRGLCQEFRAQSALARRPERIERLAATAPDDAFFRLVERCTSLRALRLPLNRANLRQLARHPSRLAQLERLELTVEDPEAAREAIALVPPHCRVVLEWPSDGDARPWRSGAWPAGVRHVHVLGAGTARFLASLAGNSDPLSTEIAFRLPSHEHLATARAEYEAVFAALAAFPSAPVMACAPCLTPCGEPDLETWCDYGALSPDGRTVNLDGLLRHFILAGYFVKSDRCADCAAEARCRGMHINFIRVFGFRCLRPIAPNTREAHG